MALKTPEEWMLEYPNIHSTNGDLGRLVQALRKELVTRCGDAFSTAALFHAITGNHDEIQRGYGLH